MNIVILIILLLAFFASTAYNDISFQQRLSATSVATKYSKKDANYWHLENRKTLNTKNNQLKNILRKKTVNRKAMNVIFFLGDGMGLSTITASRIYKANLENKDPDDVSLIFEKFPHVALSKVNTLNTIVADSAASATSYLCGVKTYITNIGVSGNVVSKDCNASKVEANKVTSIIKWAQEKGKSTGVVTNTRITHATPAVTYAHSAFRDWEHSAGGDCDDIAKQMVFGETGKNINILLGGGRREFLPVNTSDDILGMRNDSVNLIQAWLDNKKDMKQRAKYLTTKHELSEVNDEETDYILGLFANDHLSYSLDKKSDSKEPSLEEMTVKAIRFLQKNKKGFVLLVEGGRIDTANHENKAKRALDETVQFDKTIERALTMIDPNNTLVLVTADHSHSLTINGYQGKRSNILGKTDDGYTTLLYTNGPGNNRSVSQDNETDADNYVQNSAFFRNSSAHSGEDIPVYATGPGSHLFSGVVDQTFIAHVISYAACIGPLADLC